jgi:hypothetical protein
VSRTDAQRLRDILTAVTAIERSPCRRGSGS